MAGITQAIASKEAELAEVRSASKEVLDMLRKQSERKCRDLEERLRASTFWQGEKLELARSEHEEQFAETEAELTRLTSLLPRMLNTGGLLIK